MEKESNEKDPPEIFIRREENEIKVVDMHMHTVYSDGELTPDELIKRASKNKVKTLAITDHDTILGLKNITNNQGINIINGIEMTAKVDRGRMHILGYDFNINDSNLNTRLKELRTNSYYAIFAILDILKKDYNIIFDYDDIKEILNSKGSVGRPHIARLMVKYGYVKSVEEAFLKYLISAHEKIGLSKKGISYEECINLIKSANGIAILAHPNQLLLNDHDLEITLKNLISCGLDGIEVYHSKHSKEEINKYLELANKYNLLISGGSDFHGDITKPDIELGTGCNNNLKIKKLSLLDKINERNKK